MVKLIIDKYIWIVGKIYFKNERKYFVGRHFLIKLSKGLSIYLGEYDDIIFSLQN